MLDFSVAEVSKVISAKLIGDPLKFSGVAIDSNSVENNNMFVAIKGARHDGHDFIEQAIKRGAKAFLVSNPEITYADLSTKYKVCFMLVDDTVKSLGKIGKWHRNKFDIKIAGITGSMGKTSTRGMLASILEQKASILNPEKNYNTDITVPITLLNLEPSHKYAVMEMGACRKGNISELMHIIDPDLSVITNIGPCHLETFGDLDGVANAKTEAYKELKKNGIAIVNVDDAYAPFMISQITTQKIITFALHSKADITAKSVSVMPESLSFVLEHDNNSVTVTLNTIGMHNIHNALAAAACAIGFGIDLGTIKIGLESYQGIARRLEIHIGPNGAKIIDDSYNANPVSVKSALISLSNDANPKKLFVFADMGELGESEVLYHEDIGRFAEQCGINTLLATGKLAKHAVDNFSKNTKFYPKKSDLVLDLKSMLDKDTTVLVKGSNSQKLDEVIGALLEK